jgi:proteic killer suppression protein
MIKTFKGKDLRDFFESGSSSKIRVDLQKRALRRLDALEQAEKVGDLNLPGFNFHPLKGFNPTRYSIHINGPWCITFTFLDGHAYDVDIEQYH